MLAGQPKNAVETRRHARERKVGIARRAVLYGASILIGLYLLALLAARVRGPQPAPGHPYFAGTGFLVIAHRGGRGMGPENTLPLFREAVAAGADVLEMDVRLSADGVLVVHHDRRVRRTTGATGRVDSLTAAQLQALDAGFGWTRDGRSYPFRGKGYRIPRLAEVLRAFPGQRMLIELKPRLRRAAEALCGEIRGAGMQYRVAVAGFDGGTVGAFRSLCPEVPTSAAGGEVIAWKALHLLGLGNLYAPEFALFAVPERVGRLRVVDRGFASRARERNLPVQVWTVNETEEMQRLIDLGVNGILTDRPGRLLELLREKGLR